MTVAGSGFDTGGASYGAQYRCVFTLGCGGSMLAPDADSSQAGCRRMSSVPSTALSATLIICTTPQWGAANPYTGASSGADGMFTTLSLYNTAKRQLVAAAAASPASSGSVGLGFSEGWRGLTPAAVAVTGGGVITLVGFGLDTGCSLSLRGCYLCRFRSGVTGSSWVPVAMFGALVACSDRWDCFCNKIIDKLSLFVLPLFHFYFSAKVELGSVSLSVVW